MYVIFSSYGFRGKVRSPIENCAKKAGHPFSVASRSYRSDINLLESLEGIHGCPIYLGNCHQFLGRTRRAKNALPESRLGITSHPDPRSAGRLFLLEIQSGPTV